MCERCSDTHKASFPIEAEAIEEHAKYSRESHSPLKSKVLLRTESSVPDVDVAGEENRSNGEENQVPTWVASHMQNIHRGIAGSGGDMRLQ